MQDIKNTNIISKNRIDWMDYAKGICILLVIVGHEPNLPAWLKSFIYTFHMPTFFYCSGYFFTTGCENFKSFLLKKAKSLLLPYYVYSISSYIAFDVILNWIQREPINVKKFWGIFIQLQKSDFKNDIWFFTGLMIANIYFFIIKKVIVRLASSKKLIHLFHLKQSWRIQVRITDVFLCVITFIMAIVLFVIRKFNDFLMPWYLDVAVLALPFMAVGYFMRIYGTDMWKSWSRKHRRVSWESIGCCGSLIICIVFTYLDYRLCGTNIDYHLCRMGNPITAYSAGFSGIAFIFLICRRIKHFGILKFIGRYSNLYYLMDWVGSLIILKIISFAGLKLHWIGTLCASLFGASYITIPIVMICCRYFYFLLGMKKKDCQE